MLRREKVGFVLGGRMKRIEQDQEGSVGLHWEVKIRIGGVGIGTGYW